MIKLDYLTLAVITSLLTLATTISFTITRIINEYEKGLEMLALSSAIFSFGFFIVFFAPILGVYYIPLNNIAAISSLALLLEGVFRFRVYEREQLRKKLFWLFFIFISILSFLNMENTTIRFIFFDIIASGLLFAIAFFFSYKSPGEEKLLSGMFSLSFIFIASFFLNRWALALRGAFYSEVFYKEYMTFFLFCLVIWLMFFMLITFMILNHRSQLRVTKLASIDYLTGLNNRRSINRKLELMLEETETSEKKYILFLLDINGFKQLNDTYGHIFGDSVLKKMAEKLGSLEEKNDFIGRLGGDEFILIKDNTRLDECVLKIKESIKINIENLFHLKEYKVSLKTSIGYAYLSEYKNIDKLMHAADIKMYEEKTSERELTTVF